MRACWVSVALENEDLNVPALRESLDEVRANLDVWQTWVVRSGGRMVGSVRARLEDDGSWNIGRLCVAPDLEGRGLGRVLLDHIQAVAPAEASRFWLFTGGRSLRNQRFYRRNGFSIRPGEEPVEGTVAMTKPRRRTTG
ncbi:GNAT family N-acetyltransferase [Nocardioides sp. Kera G14]|nr:GNAT family N-acetyltransferase [Nocardioides sp. Kera G14]